MQTPSPNSWPWPWRPRRRRRRGCGARELSASLLLAISGRGVLLLLPLRLHSNPVRIDVRRAKASLLTWLGRSQWIQKISFGLLAVSIVQWDDS